MFSSVCVLWGVEGTVPFEVLGTDIYGVSSKKAPIYSYGDRWDRAHVHTLISWRWQCMLVHIIPSLGSGGQWEGSRTEINNADVKTQCKNANLQAQKKLKNMSELT